MSHVLPDKFDGKVSNSSSWTCTESEQTETSLNVRNFHIKVTYNRYIELMLIPDCSESKME